MQFKYAHDIPTVEQAMVQAVGYFTKAGHPEIQGALDASFQEIAKHALGEIRMILSSEMSVLFDITGQAADWNDAVEKCIQLVEGRL